MGSLKSRPDVRLAGPYLPGHERCRLDVIEVDPELSRRSLRQKCLAGAAWAMQQNSVLGDSVSPEFFGVQPVVHYRRDPALLSVHSAYIGKCVSRDVRPLDRCGLYGSRFHG